MKLIVILRTVKPEIDRFFSRGHNSVIAQLKRTQLCIVNDCTVKCKVKVDNSLQLVIAQQAHSFSRFTSYFEIRIPE